MEAETVEQKYHDTFNDLLETYNEVKAFERENAYKILTNYSNKNKLSNKEKDDKDNHKFQLTYHPGNGNIPALKARNLSSTAVCAYAFSRYEENWVTDKLYPVDNDLFTLFDYYRYVIDTIDLFFQNSANYTLPEEFTILNSLYMLEKLGEAIGEKKIEKETLDLSKVNLLINGLCNQYLFNERNEENQHPFIYYRFLCILKSWNKIKPETQALNNTDNKKNYEVDQFKMAFERIYALAKREMYRQIALYEAKDLTLFDVKRLIYSLLIVTMENTYTNNWIKKEVLKIIFSKQSDEKGLWPIGQIVKPIFDLDQMVKTVRISFEGLDHDVPKKPISSAPILTSVECIIDMLMHEHISQDLHDFQEQLKLIFDWINKKLKKGELNGDIEGWIPEYDGSHTAKSWLAGYCLIFLKEYEKFLLESMEKQAFKDLKAISPKDLRSKEWDSLRDSYEYKSFLGNMFLAEERKGKTPENTITVYTSNTSYRSALLYGPAGSGKSSIAKAIANRLDWTYIEIPPGEFLDRGEAHILEKVDYVFKRLLNIKKAVIFFDDVDRLVELGENKPHAEWVIASFIPQLIRLGKNYDVKIILATNNIFKVDPTIPTRGKINFVLPIGAVSWTDRLKMLLRAVLGRGLNHDKEEIDQKMVNILGWDNKELRLVEKLLDNEDKFKLLFDIRVLLNPGHNSEEATAIRKKWDLKTDDLVRVKKLASSDEEIKNILLLRAIAGVNIIGDNVVIDPASMKKSGWDEEELDRVNKLLERKEYNKIPYNDLIKDCINNEKVKKYLLCTDFVVGSEIEYGILSIFKINKIAESLDENKKRKEEKEKNQWAEKLRIFEIFFCDNIKNKDKLYLYQEYENPFYKVFHNWNYMRYLKAPPGIVGEDKNLLIRLNNNIYNPHLIGEDTRKEYLVKLGNLAQNLKVIKSYNENIEYIYNHFSNDMRKIIEEDEIKKLSSDTQSIYLTAEFNQMIMGKSLDLGGDGSAHIIQLPISEKDPMDSNKEKLLGYVDKIRVR